MEMLKKKKTIMETLIGGALHPENPPLKDPFSDQYLSTKRRNTVANLNQHTRSDKLQTTKKITNNTSHPQSQNKLRESQGEVGENGESKSNFEQNIQILEEVFKSEVESRTKADYRRVIPILRKQPFFADLQLPDNDMEEIMQGMQIREDPPKCKTIKYGETGTNFYIILQGEVDVWAPVPFNEVQRMIKDYMEQIKSNQLKVEDSFVSYHSQSIGYITFERYVKHFSLGNGEINTTPINQLSPSDHQNFLRDYRDYQHEKVKLVLNKALKRALQTYEQEKKEEAQKFGNRMKQAFQKMIMKKQMDPIEYLVKQTAKQGEEMDFEPCNDNIWGLKLKKNSKGGRNSIDSKALALAQQAMSQHIKKAKQEKIKSLLNQQTPDIVPQDVPKHKLFYKGDCYKYDKGNYFRNCCSGSAGYAFGQLALENKDQKREATVKTKTRTTYMTLDKNTYDKAIKKILSKAVNAKVDFLMRIPCFNEQRRKSVSVFTNFLIPELFIRNQYVYKEGDPADFVYIIVNGEFELVKSLAKPDKGSQNQIEKILGKQSSSNDQQTGQEKKKKVQSNILQAKLTEIHDLPSRQKLTICMPGTLVGDEDVFSTRQKHSCSLQCLTLNGEVYKVTRGNFHTMRSSTMAWLSVMEKVAIKELRVGADYIKNEPIDFEKQDLEESQAIAQSETTKKNVSPPRSPLKHMHSPGSSKKVTLQSGQKSMSPKSKQQQPLPDEQLNNYQDQQIMDVRSQTAQSRQLIKFKGSQKQPQVSSQNNIQIKHPARLNSGVDSNMKTTLMSNKDKFSSIDIGIGRSDGCLNITKNKPLKRNLNISQVIPHLPSSDVQNQQQQKQQAPPLTPNQINSIGSFQTINPEGTFAQTQRLGQSGIKNQQKARIGTAIPQSTKLAVLTPQMNQKVNEKTTEGSQSKGLMFTTQPSFQQKNQVGSGGSATIRVLSGRQNQTDEAESYFFSPKSNHRRLISRNTKQQTQLVTKNQSNTLSTLHTLKSRTRPRDLAKASEWREFQPVEAAPSYYDIATTFRNQMSKNTEIKLKSCFSPQSVTQSKQPNFKQPTCQTTTKSELITTQSSCEKVKMRLTGGDNIKKTQKLMTIMNQLKHGYHDCNQTETSNKIFEMTFPEEKEKPVVCKIKKMQREIDTTNRWK